MDPPRCHHLSLFADLRQTLSSQSCGARMARGVIDGSVTVSIRSGAAAPSPRENAPSFNLRRRSCLFLVNTPSKGVSTPESSRAISTARLSASQRLHLPPIDVVVSNVPLWRSYLEARFVLRCFQHLSFPDAATRRCGWRHNRSTGGPSSTVLSY